MYECSVETGGLGVEGQHQLVFTEECLRVRFWVGLPLRQRNNPPPAQCMSPVFAFFVKCHPLHTC
uniref:Uncharacterized protein n=1 Tax=Anguilla anguilla TaxID=7936 RepID=A0A0E9SDP5_ANGAN